MSVFKFNFSMNDADFNETESSFKVSDDDEFESINYIKAKEIFPSDKIIKNFDNFVEKGNVFSCGDLQIGHVLAQDATRYIQEDDKLQLVENNITLAENLHSDLIEGKYEGGLKIWECTVDLADYICNEDTSIWNDATVLDLGCGTGIIGIVVLSFGAKVHFQDYNEEVLVAATIPNILLNLPENNINEIKTRCRFFSGDWCSLLDIIEKENVYKYDYILTSETIYNPKNYKKIYNIIKTCLNKTGFALLAAKTYYFGIGGSITDFKKFILDDGIMKYEVIYKNEEGVPREIIKLVFK